MSRLVVHGLVALGMVVLAGGSDAQIIDRGPALLVDEFDSWDCLAESTAVSSEPAAPPRDPAGEPFGDTCTGSHWSVFGDLYDVRVATRPSYSAKLESPDDLEEISGDFELSFPPSEPAPVNPAPIAIDWATLFDMQRLFGYSQKPAEGYCPLDDTWFDTAGAEIASAPASVVSELDLSALALDLRHSVGRQLALWINLCESGVWSALAPRIVAHTEAHDSPLHQLSTLTRNQLSSDLAWVALRSSLPWCQLTPATANRSVTSEIAMIEGSAQAVADQELLDLASQSSYGFDTIIDGPGRYLFLRQEPAPEPVRAIADNTSKPVVEGESSNDVVHSEADQAEVEACDDPALEQVSTAPWVGCDFHPAVAANAKLSRASRDLAVICQPQISAIDPCVQIIARLTNQAIGSMQQFTRQIVALSGTWFHVAQAQVEPDSRTADEWAQQFEAAWPNTETESPDVAPSAYWGL